MMLKLADAREAGSQSEYINALDGELDAVNMKLEELRRSGSMTGFSVKRALNMLNELRGRLEEAKNPHEVNAAFLDLGSVRELIEEALQTLADRQS